MIQIIMVELIQRRGFADANNNGMDDASESIYQQILIQILFLII